MSALSGILKPLLSDTTAKVFLRARLINTEKYLVFKPGYDCIITGPHEGDGGSNGNRRLTLGCGDVELFLVGRAGVQSRFTGGLFV